MAFTILKPSFWKSRREVRNGSNALIGTYEMMNAWHTKAEGDAHGRRLKFGYSGWDSRYTEMSDMSGQVLARIEPVGWWGTRYKLTHGGKDFQWKLNGWGTTFSILDGETEILRVRPGGYYKPGEITPLRPMDEKDFVPLVLHGIFQVEMVNAQAAAAAGGGGASS